MPEMQREYSKGELVEILTGANVSGFIGWLEPAMTAPIVIGAEDMARVHRAILSYKANRIRCYGEEGAYTQYFMPAFKIVEAGFAENDFKKFKEGCELLLNLISND